MKNDEFIRRLCSFRGMSTPALRRSIQRMEAGTEQADGNTQDALNVLLDAAGRELDQRRDSHTGEYDS